MITYKGYIIRKLVTGRFAIASQKSPKIVRCVSASVPGAKMQIDKVSPKTA